MSDKPQYISVKCTGCGKGFKVKHPGTATQKQYSCTACGCKFKVTFEAPGKPDIKRQPQPEHAKEGTIQKTMPIGGFNPSWTIANPAGRAVLRVKMHRLLLPPAEKAFGLEGAGLWTIGRADSSHPTCIPITGDSTVSRGCAVIEAIPAEVTLDFVLRIVKTSNPVYVNDEKLLTGESRQLHYGDKIVMGKTSMIFSKD